MTIGFEAIDTNYDRENWEAIFEWYCDRSLKLRDVVKKYAN